MARFSPLVRDVTVITPTNIMEAVQALAESVDPVAVLAGGTDLMVQIEGSDWAYRPIVLNIAALSELRFIEADERDVKIGALSSYTDIIRSGLLHDEAPLLVEAARTVGAAQIQNRGTIGGNIMNASPAADLLPPLLALGAAAVLASSEGLRTLPLYSFFLGRRRTAAKPSELLVEIILPRRGEPTVDSFRKVGTRRAQSIAKVSLAGRARSIHKTASGAVVAEFTLAAGAVGPTPLRLFETERSLRGRPIDAHAVALARQVLNTEIQPIEDFRSNAAYRRLVAGNMLEDFLAAVVRTALNRA